MAVAGKKPEVPKPSGNIERIVCNGCSVLCDDVYIETDRNDKSVLLHVVNACFRGYRLLSGYKTEERLEEPFKKQFGVRMSLEKGEAVEEAASILGDASSIRFYGIGALAYEQQLDVFRFIKKLLGSGKKVYVGYCDFIPKESAKRGIPLTSIGKCINQGDVFIYYLTDPTHSHPKLTAKLLFSRGYFRSTGKEIKRFVLMEKEDSDLTHNADVRIKIDEEDRTSFLENLKKLLETDSFSSVKLGDLDELNMKILKSYLTEAEYGVIVTTLPLNGDESKELLDFMADVLNLLNKHASGKFSLLPLTYTQNELGESFAALTVLEPGEIASITSMSDEKADVAVVFGGEYLRDEYYPGEFSFEEDSIILFDNFESEVSSDADIVIPYKMPGVEKDDLAVRLDTLTVNLRKWSDAPEGVADIGEWLNEIAEKLKIGV